MSRSCPSLWSSIPTDWVTAGVQAWTDARPQAPESAPSRCWIFVDRSLGNPDAWLATLQGDVVYLDPSREGPRQIAEWLQDAPGVQAVHILSQGAPGRLPLGASVVDALSLCDEHDEAMAVIAGVLSKDAVLVLHGFDPTADASGATLVEVLAAVTGAQVKVQAEVSGRCNEWPATEARVRAALLSAFQSAACEPIPLLDPRTLRRVAADEQPLTDTSGAASLAHC
jgi:hypothetical protein